MIFVVLNIIINGYLFFALTLIGISLSHIYVYLPQKITVNEYAGICYGIVIFISLLGLTSFGEYIIRRLSISARKPVGRENAQLLSILQEVLDNANRVYGSKFKQDTIKLFIIDNKHAEIRAYGKNTIMISRGMLKSASDEELKGVIAHCVGYLHYKFAKTILLFKFSNFAVTFIIWWYSLCMQIHDGLIKLYASKSMSTIKTIVWVIKLMLFPFLLIDKANQLLLYLCYLYTSRKYAYKADKFAANLGYRDGLISFLEKEESLTDTDNTFFGQILSSHPALLNRIGRLED